VDVTVTVRVVACDLNTMEGAIALLSAHPDIAVLTRDDPHKPDVLLVITTQMTDATLCGLEMASVSAGQPPRIIVVVERIQPSQLARAVNAGLSLLLDRRTTGYDRIAQAILAAGTVTTLGTVHTTTTAAATR
jgi:AmiR/NasT family two-component response regulator